MRMQSVNAKEEEEKRNLIYGGDWKKKSEREIPSSLPSFECRVCLSRSLCRSLVRIALVGWPCLVIYRRDWKKEGREGVLCLNTSLTINAAAKSKRERKNLLFHLFFFDRVVRHLNEHV